MHRWIVLLFIGFFVHSVMAADKTPKQLGFTFPDEWEHRAGTMMIYPARHSYGRKTNGLRKEFREVALAIAKNEPVHIYCLTNESDDCRKDFAGSKNIAIYPGDFRIDWARDNAPMVIRNKNGELATAGFRFNGWGKKYRGWEDDVDTRDNIAKKMGWPIFHSDFVLEGGSIEIANRVGIVTESCVINKNRTDWSKAKVENELKEMLGLDKIVWIKSGLMPDKTTDGHVDGILKFIADDTVLLHTTDWQRDVNYQISQDAKAELKKAGLKVIELPLMDDIVHMNFYIGSGGDVIYVPICGDPKQDEPALKVLQRLYKKVVPIVSVNIAKAGGGIHCYTQQIPK